MRELKVPYIFLTERPALQILINVEGLESLEKVLEILKEMGIPKGISSGFIHEDEKISIMSLVELKEDAEIEKVKREIEKRLSKIPKVTYEINPLRKYGRHYMLPKPLTLTLMGEPLVLIRKSRYLGYLRRICDLFNRGAYAFLRSLGEEDGRELASRHKDDLEELTREGDIFGIIEYFVNGLSFLKNIPECKLKRSGRKIKIEILEEEPPPFDILATYLYGMWKAVFEEAGLKVKELVYSNGEIAGIKISLGKEEYFVEIVKRSKEGSSCGRSKKSNVV